MADKVYIATKAQVDAKVDKVTGKSLVDDTEITRLAGMETGAQVNVLEAVKDASGSALTITNKAVQLSKAAVGLGNVDNVAVANMEFAGTQITSGTIDAARMPIATTSSVGAVKVGTGLSVTSEGVLTADYRLHFQVFSTLPEASSEYAQTIALVPKSAETQDVYTEYICINKGTEAAPQWAWEKIGETKFTLTITQTAEGITINETALQAATTSQTGLLTHADWATFNAKQDALTFDDTPTASSTNPVKSGGVYTALAGKVDKVDGKGLSTNDFTDTLKTKLDGIAEGAEVNVQADWNETTTTSDAYIQNKPTLGAAAAKGVSTTVTSGDTNLVTGGAVYTYAEPVIATKNTAFNKNFETTASNIKMDGTASVGTLETVAKADHVHPTDTSRVGFDGDTRFTIGVDSTGLYYLPSE